MRKETKLELMVLKIGEGHEPKEGRWLLEARKRRQIDSPTPQLPEKYSFAKILISPS
jgi:hypothetical protein